MQQLTSDDLIRVHLINDDRIAAIKYNVLNEPAILVEISGKSIDKKVDDIQEQCPGTFGCLDDHVLEFFFRNPVSKTIAARKSNDSRRSVLCLIKPHVVHGNQVGQVLKQIYSEGFQVTNIKLCHLDRAQCDSFLRVYEGVLPEFIQMSIHLASGPIIALELVTTDTLTDPDHDIQAKFRDLCGPYDSVSTLQVDVSPNGTNINTFC